MAYDGKVICTFVVLPRKPHFQTETWVRAIESLSRGKVFEKYRMAKSV